MTPNLKKSRPEQQVSQNSPSVEVPSRSDLLVIKAIDFMEGASPLILLTAIILAAELIVLGLVFERVMKQVNRFKSLDKKK
ncbi:hypothetical protein ACKFKF_31165 [Phormidesmis sp. 146-12]